MEGLKISKREYEKMIAVEKAVESKMNRINMQMCRFGLKKETYAKLSKQLELHSSILNGLKRKRRIYE